MKLKTALLLITAISTLTNVSARELDLKNLDPVEVELNCGTGDYDKMLISKTFNTTDLPKSYTDSKLQIKETLLVKGNKALVIDFALNTFNFYGEGVIYLIDKNDIDKSIFSDKSVLNSVDSYSYILVDEIGSEVMFKAGPQINSVRCDLTYYNEETLKRFSK